jgi:hypothetical protein
LPLILSAEKAEDIRRIGIYLGPVFLASIAGNAVYGVVFRTTAINVGGMPLLMNLLFTLAGAVIAWRMTDALGRIAWAVFALHHGVQTLAAIWGTRIGTLWSLGLIGLFAVLATASGARNASHRAVLMAICIFVVATGAVFGARYYADELLGNHSVIR